MLIASLVAYAYWIDGFYNGRFVLLQLGAMMGTTMSANVRFVIIPNQKKIMAALSAGKPHDLELSRQAKLRSLTNHYVTFPVIFPMLSAHFPMITEPALSAHHFRDQRLPGIHQIHDECVSSI